MSELWCDIQAMPMRLHTLIGELGCCLSGGQRQRLCLARALYRDPRVLFLDEATSHLDAQTEKKILDRILDLRITTISVAHRPDVIRRAGHVIFVGNPNYPNP
jgi:ATP-binding cassette subfamily B protein RaxB